MCVSDESAFAKEEGICTDCNDKYSFFQGYATWKAGRILNSACNYFISSKRDFLPSSKKNEKDIKNLADLEKAIKLIKKIDPAGRGVKERNLECLLIMALPYVKLKNMQLYNDVSSQIDELRMAREMKRPRYGSISL